MKWVSLSGEFAFLSFGGSAKGIIAIGGMAHGIVAIGGILSIGVISIGMNAVGSVAAFGLNAVAPVSLSLINGLGVYTLAGVNGWGTWSRAGTNSTGLVSRGGVNSDSSILPAIIVIVALIAASFVARGTRESRSRDKRLRDFEPNEPVVQPVSARLIAVRDDSIELMDGSKHLVVEVEEPVLRSAHAIVEGSSEEPPRVLVTLVQVVEKVQVAGETSYRARPAETEHSFVRCADIQRAPPGDHWLPKDPMEVQWVIAWTARISAVVTIVLLVALFR